MILAAMKVIQANDAMTGIYSYVYSNRQVMCTVSIYTNANPCYAHKDYGHQCKVLLAIISLLTASSLFCNDQGSTVLNMCDTK